jgi:hypothetical protein
MFGRIFNTGCRNFGIALAAFACGATACYADVVISSKPTANMQCGDGLCEPTAPKAVLNTGDLQNNIAEFGNMTVETTGNGVEANNIVVEAKFASPGSTTLNLFAHGSIRVDAAVTIGSGGDASELELTSGSGGELGALSFGPRGSISFGSTSGIFGINGGIFSLVNSLPDLISAVTASPSGFYALANSYDAKADGIYRSVPIRTRFTGYFEALGNTISRLKVVDSGNVDVGLFGDVDGSGGFGTVRNLRLVDVSIDGKAADTVGGIVGSTTRGTTLSQSSVTGSIKGSNGAIIGGLAGNSSGTIVSSWSSAKIDAATGYGEAGGIAGSSSGTVEDSFASGAVTGGALTFTGGLIGESDGTISGSFSTGAVRNGGNASFAGGLAAVNDSSIVNCYANGNVTDTGGGNRSDLGGLIGYDDGSVLSSYSIGTVSGVDSDLTGGVVGDDESGGAFSDVYWDVSTSGVSQGAGNIANDPGITALTSKQLRSGLPGGFEKSVWKEKVSVNAGFPYLIANPPPK